MGILEQTLEEVKALRSQVEALKQKSNTPNRQPLPDFCKEREITRPTSFHWADKGLIRMEKIGGRWYVLQDSVKVTSKYQRQPV